MYSLEELVRNVPRSVSRLGDTLGAGFCVAFASSAHALTHPANYSRAISSVFRCSSVPDTSDRFTRKVECVRLLIPVISIIDIGLEIGVQESSAEGSGDAAFVGPGRFFRSVTNNTNHSQLSILDDGGSRIVEALYLSYGKDGLWVVVKLTLNRAVFFSALDKRNERVINFDKINLSLIQSGVAVLKHN